MDLKRNPETPQNRAFDTWDHFKQFGLVMFPQQRSIYAFLAKQVENLIVLEAGCGNGLGTAVLERFAEQIIGTDVGSTNVEFARCLYPWIEFQQWDIQQPWTGEQAEAVVCVEVIEHIADPQTGIQNLLNALTTDGVLWLSTPNGLDKPKPPENRQHVDEYTVGEILDMIGQGFRVSVFDCEGTPVAFNTTVDPLLYQIERI